MSHSDEFWNLKQLSDGQLLESLGSVLRTKRRALAELVAHLGEVDDRRLHLEAAHSSLFAYCVGRLGMSEDEACRRIELARLARKFPALFSVLARGQISLSVALLLKPVLSPGNQLELIAAVRGKSMQQARELLAARFPRPDVPSSVRKLPERRPRQASDGAEAVACTSPAAGSLPMPSLAPAPLAQPSLAQPSSRESSVVLSAVEASTRQFVAPQPRASALDSVAHPPVLATSTTPTGTSAPSPASTPAVPLFSPPPVRNRIEPLSAQRYKVQFTADAELKNKLELARDLLRHAHPNGDFGPIVARALDLLIADLLKRRFGASARRTPPVAAPANSAPPAAPASMPEAGASRSSVAPSSTSSSSHAPATPVVATESATPVAASHVIAPVVAMESATCVTSSHAAAPAAATESFTSVAATKSVTPVAAARRVAVSPIRRSTRRAVLERDGLGCSWVDAAGVRCGSRAWLELDHRHPRRQGGSSDPDNLRLLCRSHNALAAEHAYGREHIEQATAARRQRGRGPASRP